MAETAQNTLAPLKSDKHKDEDAEEEREYAGSAPITAAAAPALIYASAPAAPATQSNSLPFMVLTR